MFADPEAWKAHQREVARQIAREEFGALRQQEQARVIDREFNELVAGPRGFEFGPAYNKLMALPVTDPKRQSIANAPSPGKALMDWWDANGGEEYRETVRSQLYPGQQRQQRDAGGRERPQNVIRPAQRIPSLNGASRGGRREAVDPRGVDGSEEAIARSAWE